MSNDHAESWEQRRTRIRLSWMRPLIWLDWSMGRVAFVLRHSGTFAVLEYLGRLTIVVAVILYFIEADDRRQQRQLQAWQIVEATAGRGRNEALVGALEVLVRSGISLSGIELYDADLSGSNLEGADFLNTGLDGANLRNANLRRARFDHADIVVGRVDVSGADLKGAYVHMSNVGGFVGLTQEQLDSLCIVTPEGRARPEGINNLLIPAANPSYCRFEGPR